MSIIPERNSIPIVAPTPTPFDNKDNPDLQLLEENILQWLDTGLSGFVVGSYGGEEFHLSQVEKNEIIKIVSQAHEGKKFFLEAKKWMKMLDPEDTKDVKGDSYQRDYDNALNILNKALSDLTRNLFDLAEKHLRIGLPAIKSALMRSNHDRSIPYTEGLMRDFTIKQIWYHSELMAQQIANPDVAYDLGLDVDNSDGTIEGISPEDNDAFFAFICFIYDSLS